MSGPIAQGRKSRVWDVFVRLFHWTTVALFATAFLSPDVKSLHEPVGYALLALVVAPHRLGIRRHAPCALQQLRRLPRRVLRYLRLLREGRAPASRPQPGGRGDDRAAAGHVGGGRGQRLDVRDRPLVRRAVGEPPASHVCRSAAVCSIGVHVRGSSFPAGCTAKTWCAAMITGRKPVHLPEHAAPDGGRTASDRGGKTRASRHSPAAARTRRRRLPAVPPGRCRRAPRRFRRRWPGRGRSRREAARPR